VLNQFSVSNVDDSFLLHSRLLIGVVPWYLRYIPHTWYGTYLLDCICYRTLQPGTRQQVPVQLPVLTPLVGYLVPGTVPDSCYQLAGRYESVLESLRR
jgi:hypothetical protein